MTEFEFIFSLYSLLLGLSLAQILSGLGRSIEHRFASEAGETTFVMGWLTPLLAIFVILDLLSFWAFAWISREELSVSSYSLLGVTMFACAYYLAARLVFPSSPENFETLDTYYFRVRRIILVVLSSLVLVQWAFNLSSPAIAERVMTPAAIGATALLLALMAGAMVAKSQRISAILLVALIVRYVVLYVR